MQRQNHPEAAQTMRGVDAITRLAFPFMTFGLLSGALWAEEAWGRYWSWDSKETWALILWLCYAQYLHWRRVDSLHRFALGFQAAGFAALIVTFLFVSLIPKLGSALHTYAQ
jgi:ABC-type transport system involved in cytochrome c biogenesis permease subunit